MRMCEWARRRRSEVQAKEVQLIAEQLAGYHRDINQEPISKLKDEPEPGAGSQRVGDVQERPQVLRAPPVQEGPQVVRADPKEIPRAWRYVECL